MSYRFVDKHKFASVPANAAAIEARSDYPNRSW